MAGAGELETRSLTAAWERIGAFEGGEIDRLTSATAPDGSLVVFAATPVGVFQSFDGGRHWRAFASAAPLLGCEAVLPSPRYAEDGRLFVGAEMRGLFSWDPAAGQWDHLLADTRVLSVAGAVDDRGQTLLLVGTEADGILRSVDGGRTWSGANPGLLDLTVLALAVSPDVARDGLAFAATPTGLYRSRNGGESWRAVELEQEDVAVQCLMVSPLFRDDRLVLAGTERHGLLRSDDAGRTWTSVPDLDDRGVVDLTCSRTGHLAAATDRGVALSEDGGRAWRMAGADLGPVLSVVTVEDGGREAILAGLPEDGIARSEDGGRTWATSNVGLDANLLLNCALVPPAADRDPAEPITILVSRLRAGVSVSTDGGQSWSQRNAGLTGYDIVSFAVSPSYAHDHTVFATTAAGLSVSRDRAATWQPAVSDDRASPVLVVTAPGAGQTDPPVVLVGLDDGAVLLSEDGGSRWDRLPSPAPGRPVLALAVSPSYQTDRLLYLAAETTPAGPADRTVGLWRTSDRARTWQLLLEERGGWPIHLVALPPNPFGETLLVGLGGTIRRPMPGAEEMRRGVRRPIWQTTALPGRSVAISGLSLSPAYPRDRTIFVATTDGAFISRDGGEHVTDWSAGLDGRAVLMVTPSPGYASNRLVYAIGLGSTIWRRHDESV